MVFNLTIGLVDGFVLGVGDGEVTVVAGAVGDGKTTIGSSAVTTICGEEK